MKSFYKTINTIFSPFLVAPVTIFLVAIKNNNFKNALIITLITTTTLTLPTFLAAIVALKLKKITNLHIKDQKQRMPFFIVAVISVVLTLFIYKYFNYSIFLNKTIVSVFITLALCFVINKFTKISLHTAAITGAITTIFLTYNNHLILFGFVMAFLVGYSRIKTKNHTFIQVFLGFVTSALITTLIFLI